MNKKKFALSLIITVVVVSVVLLILNMFSSDIDIDHVLDKNPAERVNILVVGVDKDGMRSDVNMLFSLNAKEQTIYQMSIPRDTRVEFTKGNYGKINACIGKEDGEALLIQKVKELTGMPVHSFCRVNFEGLRNMIDILGGVEFDVPMDMDYDDPYQDLHIHLKKGKQTLSGADAEGLLRYRKGYASGDLGRIDVQQEFLKEAISQKLRPKYLFKAVPMIREISKNIDTDMSVMTLAKYVWQFKNSDKIDFRTYTLPGVPKTIGGVSYYICDESATKSLVRIDFGYQNDETGGSPLSDKVID